MQRQASRGLLRKPLRGSPFNRLKIIPLERPHRSNDFQSF